MSGSDNGVERAWLGDNIIPFPPRRAGGLNRGETCSVQALVAYAAHRRGVAQTEIEGVLEDRFGGHAVTELQQRDYDAVIRFLVDLDWDDRKTGLA